MKKNSWAAVARALAVVTVTLIVTLVLVPRAWAQSEFKVLHTFTYGLDGGEPQAGLTFGPDGNLYGTTYWGGDYGIGTVYKLTPNADGSWTEVVLHSFGGADGNGLPQSQSLTLPEIFTPRPASAELMGVVWFSN